MRIFGLTQLTNHLGDEIAMAHTTIDGTTFSRSSLVVVSSGPAMRSVWRMGGAEWSPGVSRVGAEGSGFDALQPAGGESAWRFRASRDLASGVGERCIVAGG